MGVQKDKGGKENTHEQYKKNYKIFERNLNLYLQIVSKGKFYRNLTKEI